MHIVRTIYRKYKNSEKQHNDKIYFANTIFFSIFAL